MQVDRFPDELPTYSFSVPCPTTETKKVRISKRKLEKLIQQRANEISGEDPSKSYLQRWDVLNDAEWEVGDGIVKVIVPIPVDSQSTLFGPKPQRGKGRPSVLGGRNDFQAKRAVDACIEEVKVVQELIRTEQEVLSREGLTPSDLAGFFRSGANQDLRRFIVEGGERYIQIDGHTMRLVSLGSKQMVVIPGESVIEVELVPHDGRAGDFRGKILSIKSGVGFLRVGNLVRLGYLGRNDELRALLHAARHFGSRVEATTSQAICVANQKLATLEVKSIVNAKAILEEAWKRSPG
jgi:hypothetical protein